jgi:AcrR family transcriptional regulator
VVYGTDRYQSKDFLMTETISSLQPPAAQDLRGRILNAAFGAFAELGYAGTSTLEIATRAKVSKRDLYAQFPSKQAMLAAAIGERARRMQIPLRLPAPAERTALRTMLERFGAAIVNEVTRPEVIAIYRLAITEAERSPDVARTLDTAGRASSTAALMELLRGAQALGMIGPGDPEAMAARFFGLLWENLLVRLLLGVSPAPAPAEIERRAAAAADALLTLYPAITPGSAAVPATSG